MESIEGPSETIYAIKVAEVLWDPSELAAHLIQDQGAPDRSQTTQRTHFSGEENMKKIDKLKSNFTFFIYYSIIY